MNPTSHGTPENPSPGPPNGPNSNPHQNPIGANPEQIEMIKMFQVNIRENVPHVKRFVNKFLSSSDNLQRQNIK